MSVIPFSRAETLRDRLSRSADSAISLAVRVSKRQPTTSNPSELPLDLWRWTLGGLSWPTTLPSSRPHLAPI